MSKKSTLKGKKNYERKDSRDKATGFEKDSLPRTQRNSKGTKPYGTNDAGWYIPSQLMVKDVASIPFGYRLGDRIGEHYQAPGIVHMYYAPTVGTAESNTDPVNAAAMAILSFLKSKLSGSLPYDHTDLMMYLLGMDSVYMGITWLQRAIAVARNWSAASRYTPTDILSAMGIDPNSVMYRIPEITTKLNQLILKASTLATPANLTLYKRHAWLNGKLYRDENNDFSQLYFFSPEYLYKYTIPEVSSGLVGHMLAPTAFTILGGYSSGSTATIKDNALPSALATWDSYFDIVSDCLNALYEDEDAGIMSANIIRAYGDSLTKLSLVDSNSVLDYAYEPEVLEQIHNAVLAGAPAIQRANMHADSGYSMPYCAIYQNAVSTATGFNPVLKSTMAFIRPLVGVEDYHVDILDLHHDPSPELNMVATRFRTELQNSPLDADVTIAYSPSTEVFTRMLVTTAPSSNPTLVSGQLYVHMDNGTPDTLYNSISSALAIASVSQQISYMPLLYVVYVQNDEVVTKYLFANTDRVTALSKALIRQMNEVALLGLFDVERMGLISG